MKNNPLVITNPRVILSLLIAFLLIPALAQAQSQSLNSDPARKVRIGLKAGLNGTNMYVDEEVVDEEKFKTSFHGGIFVKAPLTRFFAIQPEILFSSKGTRVEYKQPSGVAAGQVRFNLQYLEIPLLAVLNLGPINLHGGVYGAYLLKANVRNLAYRADTPANQTPPVNEKVSLQEDDFERFDYGLMGGLGVDIQSFHVGARVQVGLEETGKQVTVGNTTFNPVRGGKNFGGQLYVGFSF